MQGSETQLEQAILRRICAYLGLELTSSSVDYDAPLVGEAQGGVAGHLLDSLSLAEAIVMLEGDLDIPILGCAELAELESAATLARYLARVSEPAALVAFERKWIP